MLSGAVEASGVTARVAKDPKYLLPIELIPGPETVVAMNEPGDSAIAYQAAIDLYTANPMIYDRWDSANIDKLEAVEKLLEVTHFKEMHLFDKNPGKVINFANSKDPVEALRIVGNMAARKAQLLKLRKKPEEAKKYAEAAFALGAKMFKERVIFEEYDAGMGLLGVGADFLKTMAVEENDTAKSTKADEFINARKNLIGTAGRLFDQRSITKSIDGNVSGLRAGDVFALATKSQERLWRVEACLQLARTARNVGNNGRGTDQRHARALLEQLALDPDPIIRTAAIKARDITDDEYHKQN